ncbi:MAG: glycosyltransferase family 1 protein [Solirubrobacterales bacterium]|nr:glycosyltransferase family 1 protein [Solirubrobacterales bacterium]
MTLRVGFNLAYLVEDSGGSGTYARQLLPHLLLASPDVELTGWIGTTAPDWLAREPWASEVRWVRLPVPGIGTPWHLWHELAGIGLDARRRRLDIVHGLAYLAPLVHPGVATVATILDVIWKHHPEATGARFQAVMGTLAPLVGRRSTRLIAISEAARDDIAATLRLDVEKFDVTPLGILPAEVTPAAADAAAVRERLGLGQEPIVLCVAAKRAHKNLHGLIRGFALLADGSDLGDREQLVLPGSPNEYEDELRALARQLGVEHRVHFPGWVSDTDLESLYGIASCFVLPTFQEGFGLPVLEAMARGLPVACSDIPVLTEVVGDAAVLFDPNDPAGIAHAIARVARDRELARDLVIRGQERCRLFTWERTARATLASYERALDGG